MQNITQQENPTPQSAPALRGYLPVLLLALALVIWFGFQLLQTLKTRDNLVNSINSQEPQIQAANKIKTSLSALASGTKQLSIQGNPNATQIVNALAQRGINIADPNVTQQTGK